jgi:hypothetical protein
LLRRWGWESVGILVRILSVGHALARGDVAGWEGARVADERRLGGKERRERRTEGYINMQDGEDLGLRCGATQLTYIIFAFASWSGPHMVYA